MDFITFLCKTTDFSFTTSQFPFFIGAPLRVNLLFTQLPDYYFEHNFDLLATENVKSTKTRYFYKVGHTQI